jgi:hypothetical protein
MKLGGLNEIEPGRQYRQRNGGRAVCTACVLSIHPDRSGIPHVLFDLSLKFPSGVAMAGERRILALDQFTTLYPVPL